MAPTSIHWVVSRAIVAVFTLLSGIAVTATAQEPLYQFTGPPEAITLPDGASEFAQQVRFNPRAALAPEISIDLFGQELLAVRDRSEQQQGARVWVGHVQGDPAAAVVISQRGGITMASVQYDGGTYEARFGPDGRQRLVLRDFSALPPEAGDTLIPAAEAGSEAGAAATDGSAGVAVVGNTVQDLLIAYTTGTCSYWGGSADNCPAAELALINAVANMNTAYATSQINITMNIVGQLLTGYANNQAGDATLYALTDPADGVLDEVHVLRDQLGADLVAMVAPVTGVCGIAWLYNGNSYYGNSVTDPACVSGWTLAHEIGHNQGAHHDRVTTGSTSTTAYNFGYRRCSGGGAEDVGAPYFRTVLAYSCASAGRVGYFSNPNVSYSGVATGIDPDIDPANGAFNARRLNDTAAGVAGFRAAVPTTPPTQPQNFREVSHDYASVDLAWDDVTGETQYVLERDSGAGWSQVATLGANVASYVDNGLADDTDYRYRLRARNSAGDSEWSATVLVHTDPAPPSIDFAAVSETSGRGVVSGSYLNTAVADGVVQTITETASGPRRSPFQGLQHSWNFDFTGGAGGTVVTVLAAVSGSEGMVFSYNLNGLGAVQMFTVDAATSGALSYQLPAGATGTLQITVQDAESNKNEAVDSVSVDQVIVTSIFDAGNPPAVAPSNVQFTSVTFDSVSGTFADNTEDEFGFEVYRATALPATCADGTVVATPGAGAATGTVAFTDPMVSAETTYWYWVSAFNFAGSSGCSAAASVTTPPAPAIRLTATGSKVKGSHIVDLEWSGVAGTSVDVYRDGSFSFATANDGAHTDALNTKGGATYVYQVCEADSMSNCSATVTVVF